MPFCVVEHYGHRVEIFYQLYGYGDTKVLLIPGVAANHEAWGPQLVDLCGTDVPSPDGVENGNGNQRDGHDREPYAQEQAGKSGTGIQVCAFDNRGVGRSSKPEDKKHYSVRLPADQLRQSVQEVLDSDRGGSENHDNNGEGCFGIEGSSWMEKSTCSWTFYGAGGMIACKLASIAPERVISLTMLSTTGGGYQCLPKVDRALIKIAYRFLRAKTPEARAHVDLDTHYTKDYLDTLVGDEYRRAILYKEYVKNLSNSGMQPKHGLDGQFNACWTHGVSSSELDRIRSHGVRVVVIHGTGDIVAQVKHARKLAEKLRPVSRMIELPGGHMITHQHTKEVNEAILAAIKDEFPSAYSDYSDETLQGRGWQIWQRGKADGGKLVSELLGSRCVGSVVRILIRYWPQWLSLKYAFPTFYWFLRGSSNFIFILSNAMLEPNL